MVPAADGRVLLELNRSDTLEIEAGHAEQIVRYHICICHFEARAASAAMVDVEAELEKEEKRLQKNLYMKFYRSIRSPGLMSPENCRAALMLRQQLPPGSAEGSGGRKTQQLGFHFLQLEAC